MTDQTQLAKLGQQLEDASNRLDLAERFDRALKKLMVAVVVLALVVVGVGYVAVRTTCLGLNRDRASTVELWTGVLARQPLADPGPDATAEERKRYDEGLRQREEFTTDLLAKFAPQNCLPG